jgi:tetratricopeptide (TPR) repeat protein
MPPEPGSRGRPGLQAAILLLAIAAVYAGSIGGSFQFDDWNVIVDEPRVATVAAWWDSMPGIRPLLKLSYAVGNGGGLGAAGFHVGNVAIHAANTLLVLLLSRALARREGSALPHAGAAAFFTAAIFALHPAQTEAVTYVSGRATSLSATFVLGSVLCWIAGRERGHPALTIALSPLLLLCALLTKETAVVAPAILLLWIATERARFARPLRADLALLAVPAAVAGSAAACALAFSPTYRRLLALSLSTRGIVASGITQCVGVAYLASHLVRIDRLNADPALPVRTGWTLEAAACAVLLAAAVCLGIVCIRRAPAVAFGILWFFLSLAPTNSVIPRLDVANDRQLYLALLGPAWIVSWGAFRIAPRRLVAAAALAAVCFALGAGTVLRNRVYETEVTFWTDVVRKSPDNGRAFNNLGYAFALESRKTEAEEAFVEALRIDPTDVRAAVNLKLLRADALVPRDASRVRRRRGARSRGRPPRCARERRRGSRRLPAR